MRTIVALLVWTQLIWAQEMPFAQPYLQVYDDAITPGTGQAHERALERFKQAAVPAGYRESFHFFRMDDGRYPAFNPQRSAEFSKSSEAHWAAVADKIDTALLAENAKVYRETIASQDLYLLARRPAYGHPTEGPRIQAFVVVDILYLKHARIEEAGRHLTALAELATRKEAPLHYAVYAKTSGTGLPALFRYRFAENREDYERRALRTARLLGAEGEDLHRKLESCLRTRTRRTGWYLPHLSY